MGAPHSMWRTSYFLFIRYTWYKWLFWVYRIWRVLSVPKIIIKYKKYMCFKFAVCIKITYSKDNFLLACFSVTLCVHFITWTWGKVSMVVKTKLFKKYFDKYSTSASQESGPRIGLECNIELPSTGTLYNGSFKTVILMVELQKKALYSDSLTFKTVILMGELQQKAPYVEAREYCVSK